MDRWHGTRRTRAPGRSRVPLALLVSLPQALLALLACRKASATAATSVLVGSLLVCWILVEALFLQVFEGLQVAYLVIGFVQVGLGLLLGLHDPGLENAPWPRRPGRW